MYEQDSIVQHMIKGKCVHCDKHTRNILTILDPKGDRRSARVCEECYSQFYISIVFDDEGWHKWIFRHRKNIDRLQLALLK